MSVKREESRKIIDGPHPRIGVHDVSPGSLNSAQQELRPPIFR